MYSIIVLHLVKQSNKFEYLEGIVLGGNSMCKINSHYRKAHMVRGHFRDTKNGRIWIGPHMRSATIVNDHCIIE